MPSKGSLPANKRRKTTTDTVITELENQLKVAVDNQTSLNPLVDLILLASKKLSEPQSLHKALYALYRTFCLLIDLGRFCGTVGEPEEAGLVRAWLTERFSEYTALLCKCLQHDQKAIRDAALEILFSLLKHISEAFTKATKQPQLHITHFRKLLNGLLLTDHNDAHISIDVRDHFTESWFTVHDDIRWFFLRETAILLGEHKFNNKNFPENVLSILERLTTMPTEQSEVNEFWIPSFSKSPPGFSIQAAEEDGDDIEIEDDWRTFFDGPEKVTSETQPQKHKRVYRLSTHQCLHSLASHRAQFTQCWMNLLPYLSSSSTLSMRALNFLHQGVMPHLTKPVRLMDWIAGCVDFGGSIGLLALNGLFTLIQHHNFHLPATLLASFIKRLSRLSLSAPPAAIIMIIPFTYNILKRHPACMVMIHQDVDSESEGQDPFIADEPSPYITNALSSSLWELMSHRNHYHSSVATLARIFTDAFTKPGYNMEDFLDHTYTTLFETEAKRKIKKEPPLALEDHTKLFPISKGEGQTEEDTLIHSDVVTELWAF
ncbi:hypothetical protein Clacol_009133 [Clathrus columnatus]|uniref:CCAAT-binding factor domain-containing protein n=1 Tax=Clathrus columnatus TaxID=1419009 RepID=A0AAV5AKD8_9AGAM|nr:hypothetical protein Clacol_009133 [Clathrus columnatus]